MAVHRNMQLLIIECLTEYVITALSCLKARKQDGGCYGYPAALLLFSIVDAIGSYHRGDKVFITTIDGKSRTIDGEEFKYYFVLNSDYYGQQLRERDIRHLYDYYRCLLCHNSAIAPGHYLELGSEGQTPFDHLDKKQTSVVRLVPFYNLSVNAVRKFVKSANITLPNSDQMQVIGRKGGVSL